MGYGDFAIRRWRLHQPVILHPRVEGHYVWTRLPVRWGNKYLKLVPSLHWLPGDKGGLGKHMRSGAELKPMNLTRERVTELLRRM